MSRNFGTPIQYTCMNDCQQTGCPGHQIRCRHEIGQDLYVFEFSNKLENGEVGPIAGELIFDEALFAAMRQSEDSLARGYIIDVMPETGPAGAVESEIAGEKVVIFNG